MIFSIISNFREKKYIPIAVNWLLEYKKNNQLKKEEVMKTIVVGDVLRNGEKYYLVVYVDEKYYKVLTVHVLKNSFESVELFVWLISNKIRRESRKKSKLVFTERLQSRIIISHKTGREIDFTLSDVEIYHQI